MPISTDGGREPAWSPSGRELFYRSSADDEGKRWMMVVDMPANAGSSAGRPRVLFRDDFATTGWARGFDVTADGERFLMVREETRPPRDVTELHVVLNWFEELRRLVPTDN